MDNWQALGDLINKIIEDAKTKKDNEVKINANAVYSAFKQGER